MKAFNASCRTPIALYRLALCTFVSALSAGALLSIAQATELDLRSAVSTTSFTVEALQSSDLSNDAPVLLPSGVGKVPSLFGDVPVEAITKDPLPGDLQPALIPETVVHSRAFDLERIDAPMEIIQDLLLSQRESLAEVVDGC